MRPSQIDRATATNTVQHVPLAIVKPTVFLPLLEVFSKKLYSCGRFQVLVWFEPSRATSFLPTACC